MQNATPSSFPSPPTPASLFARTPGAFPSRGSARGGALEGPLEREPRLHSTAKKRSKGGSRVARNANRVYARFCAGRERVSGTRTRVPLGWGGRGLQLRTRACSASVSVAEEEEEEEPSGEGDRLPGTLDSRDPETRVKPSLSLIGGPPLPSSRPARREKGERPWLGLSLGRSLVNPRPTDSRMNSSGKLRVDAYFFPFPFFF